jgi:hypothetical protein
MGLLAENLVWMLKHTVPSVMLEHPTKINWSIIELGNQFAYIWEKPFETYPARYIAKNQPPWPVAKGMFEHLGFAHTSVDINGNDGAIALDLSFPQVIPPGIGQADIVTDFGTSEHVPDLYECQKNIWNFCKIGGFIFQVNPEPGSWPGHGHHYRDAAFYRSLKERLNFKLVDVRRDFACGNSLNGWNTWACYVKTREEFIDRATFEEIKVFNR